MKAEDQPTLEDVLNKVIKESPYNNGYSLTRPYILKAMEQYASLSQPTISPTEKSLREVLDEHEKNHDYAIATESVRAILDTAPIEPTMSQEEIREGLSDYAHEAWNGWMKYMFSKAELNTDGTWTMPKWAVDRWQRQMNTKYRELPEEEKKSDREEADKMLAILSKLPLQKQEDVFDVDPDKMTEDCMKLAESSWNNEKQVSKESLHTEVNEDDQKWAKDIIDDREKQVSEIDVNYMCNVLKRTFEGSEEVKVEFENEEDNINFVLDVVNNFRRVIEKDISKLKEHGKRKS